MDCIWCGAEAVTQEHIETCPKRPMWDVLAIWRWINGWWEKKETEGEQTEEEPGAGGDGEEEVKVSP